MAIIREALDALEGGKAPEVKVILINQTPPPNYCRTVDNELKHS